MLPSTEHGFFHQCHPKLFCSGPCNLHHLTGPNLGPLQLARVVLHLEMLVAFGTSQPQLNHVEPLAALPLMRENLKKWKPNLSLGEFADWLMISCYLTSHRISYQSGPQSTWRFRWTRLGTTTAEAECLAVVAHEPGDRGDELGEPGFLGEMFWVDHQPSWGYLTMWTRNKHVILWSSTSSGSITCTANRPSW